MKKKTIIQMMVGILFLLTLIISSTYAYFNIVNTSNNNTTSNYNAKLEDIEKYGTSLLTGGEGELHLRVKASDMTPSKIGNKYYATTSDEDYQLRRGNHIVSKATIQKGLSNYEYNCTSKLTITLDGTMVSEDGLQVGDAKIYLRGTNNNIKNEEYDLKTLLDELDTNSDGKKEYTREIEYLLTSDNEGKVMIDAEFANNSNNQTTSSGKNLNIEITNSELVCGLGNNKVYVNMYGNSSDKYAYRTAEWRDKIITASFVDYKPSEEELLTKPIYWDLTDASKSETGSVIGWLEEREETDTYNLYIGSDKEIYILTLQYAFQSMTNLQEIKFDNLNTSETTSMQSMFFMCRNLINLDLSTFDTSKVTDMSSIFNMNGSTGKIENLDISNFDTSKVTNMSYMFKDGKYKYLDLSVFDTTHVTNMSYMFCNLDNITSMSQIKGFGELDTSKVTNMSSMFSNSEIIDLNLSTFDTSKVKDMSYMFNSYKGTTLDLSNFDTSSVTKMNSMFSYSNITDLDISNFNTSNVTNMNSMFDNCVNLINLDISNFDTSKVENMRYMFRGVKVKSLEDIKGLYEFDTSKVTNIGGIFAGCKNITEIDLTKFELDSVTNMSQMFSSLDSITSTDQIKGFKELNTSKVTDMSNMFYASKITDLDISHFDTSKVTNMTSMFSGYKGTTLDLSNFDTTNVTGMSLMFYNCTNLKKLKLNKAIFDKVTSYTNMFGYKLENSSYRVPSDIHLIIKKGQETFINERLNETYPEGHKATIDLVD